MGSARRLLAFVTALALTTGLLAGGLGAVTATATASASETGTIPISVDIQAAAEVGYGYVTPVVVTVARADTGEPLQYRLVTLRLRDGNWYGEQFTDDAGQAHFEFGANDDAGDRMLDAYYPGNPDDGYAAAEASRAIRITPAPTRLSFDVPDSTMVAESMIVIGRYGHDISWGAFGEQPVAVELVDAGGALVSSRTATTDYDGTWMTAFEMNVPEGNYTVRAAYAGSRNYSPSSAQGSVRVDRRPLVMSTNHQRSARPDNDGVYLTVNTQREWYQPAHDGLEVTVRLLDGDNAVFTETLAMAELYDGYYEAAKAVENVVLQPGTYELETVFAGNATYLPATRREAFVKYADVALPVYLGPTTVYQGEPFEAAWRVVRQSDGEPLPHHAIWIAAPGVDSTFDRVTDATGVVRVTATIPVNSNSNDVYAAARPAGLIDGQWERTYLDVRPASAVTTLATTPVTARRGEPAALSATLRRGTTAVAGEPVAFTVAGATHTATTGADGVARVTVPTADLAEGTHAVTVSYAGSDTFAAATASTTLTVLRYATTLTAGPPAVASRGETAEVSARLVRTSSNTPLAGATVTFAVAGHTLSGTTGSDGWARASVPADLAPGDYGVAIAFAGSPNDHASSTTGALRVVRATTTTWLGDVSGRYGETVTLRARVADAFDGTPLSGRAVTFTVDGHVHSVTTGADGVATAAHVVASAPGQHAVAVAFPASGVDGASNATGHLSVGWQYEFRGADPNVVVRLNPGTKHLQASAPAYTSAVIKHEAMTVTSAGGHDVVELDVRDGDLTLTGVFNLTTGQFSATWTVAGKGAWSTGRA